MVRTFLNIYTADLGIKANEIITASVVLPAARYPGPEAKIAFFDQLTARLAAIPGVESVAVADGIPGLYAPRLGYEVASDRGPDEQPREVSALIINPDYFRTVGASVLSGRAFTDDDRASAVPVTLVNERFASQHWPGENPVGKHIRLFTGTTPGVWRSIVGVVSNIVQNDKTGQNFEPVVYLPFREKPSAGIILARTRVPPRSLRTAFRREIQAADSDLVIGSGYGSLEGPAALTESLAFHYWSKGVNGGLFLVFATIAFVIASIGLYAVIAHSVSERTQEIGIRMAVGATQRTILTLVFKMGLFRLGFGLIVGLVVSVAVNRMLEAELTQVSPADPVTLMITCAVLVLSAALGCWLPARRAMRVDPVVALKHN